MLFYDRTWAPINARIGPADSQQALTNSKLDLARQISSITKIDPRYLVGPEALHGASIATKMSWMAGRTTRDVEDIAYSLLGLFDVSITPQYGEGERAFLRLQRKLLQGHTFDESLFAWKSGEVLRCFGAGPNPWKPPDRRWGLLAPSPDCFVSSRDIYRHDVSHRMLGGFQKTQEGLSFSLPHSVLINKIGGSRDSVSLVLNCAKRVGPGRVRSVRIELARTTEDIWTRISCDTLGEKENAKSDRGHSSRTSLAENYTTLIVRQPQHMSLISACSYIPKN
jgi:hypothetical protein